MCSLDHQTLLRLELDCWGAPRPPRKHEQEIEAARNRAEAERRDGRPSTLSVFRWLRYASDRAAS